MRLGRFLCYMQHREPFHVLYGERGRTVAENKPGQTPEPGITKIVITGGPCGGKSAAMSRVQAAFGEQGYRVLYIPETATELITGGVTPWTCGSRVEYQRIQFILQKTKERLYEEAALTMDAEKILIVCDRGLIDNRAYMTKEEFEVILEEDGRKEEEIRSSYNAVFHLVSAVKGAEKFYTTANNQARRETPEEAAILDDRVLSAWTGHPHLRVIDNSTDFEGKMQRLIREITEFLEKKESDGCCSQPGCGLRSNE